MKRKTAQPTRLKKKLASMAPDELWMDDTIPAYILVRIDPLDITSDIVERAEHPEFENLVLARLPK